MSAVEILDEVDEVDDLLIDNERPDALDNEINEVTEHIVLVDERDDEVDEYPVVIGEYLPYLGKGRRHGGAAHEDHHRCDEDGEQGKLARLESVFHNAPQI